MKLCAIVEKGKVVGVVPVTDDHDFGQREGYSHISVKLLEKLPNEYDEPREIKQPEGLYRFL